MKIKEDTSWIKFKKHLIALSIGKETDIKFKINLKMSKTI